MKFVLLLLAGIFSVYLLLFELLPFALSTVHPYMHWVSLGMGAMTTLLWLLPSHLKLWKLRVAVTAFAPVLYTAWTYWFASLMRRAGYPAYATVSQSWIGWWTVGILTVLTCFFLTARYFTPKLKAWQDRWSRRSSMERTGRTDIVLLQTAQHPPKDFDPWKHVQPSKVFLGMTTSKRPAPTHLPIPLPHIQVAGPSGAGKGVLLQSLALQCAMNDEAVFYFDPKRDEFGPHPLRYAAQEHGQSFTYLDLAAGPQINAFAGTSAEQLEELLIASLGLANKGDAADHYRGSDRWAARTFAKLLALEPSLTPADAFKKYGSAFEKGTPDFFTKLRELASIESLNAHQGLDLRSICQGGGVVYIVGSTRNQKLITAQRLLLIRLIQLAEERDRITGTPRQICVILDEFKYHISRTALEALGTARDKGMHLVLAHQSLGDLKDVPLDLTPEAVHGAVVENCRVKVVYRTEDPDTTNYFARRSGNILIDDEHRAVTRNLGLAENIEAERLIQQTERHFIDENMLMSLPSRHAVVFGLDLPQIVHISPFKVEKSAEAIQPNIVPGASLDDGMEIL